MTHTHTHAATINFCVVNIYTSLVVTNIYFLHHIQIFGRAAKFSFNEFELRVRESRLLSVKLITVTYVPSVLNCRVVSIAGRLEGTL